MEAPEPHGRSLGRTPLALALVLVVAVLIVVAVYAVGQAASTDRQTTSLSDSSSTTTSSTTSGSSSGGDGVVTGYVTAGPSQPVCSSGQSCDENMTGYEVVFTAQCAGASCLSETAPLNPAGHYSILLPAGSYALTGLSPECKWMGCSTAFPQAVQVVAGMQVELDVQIDTGIR